MKRRKSLRLKHWDYKTAGLYFVTISINNHINLFGEIKNGKMTLNNVGLMIDEQWKNIFSRFDNATSQQYIIMPNHFHAIIKLSTKPSLGVNQANNIQQTSTLGEIIGAFKSITTIEYIQNVRKSDWQAFDKKLWQRNYYEHIIRDDDDLNRILEYIETNPLKWELDSLHPNKKKLAL